MLHLEEVRKRKEAQVVKREEDTKAKALRKQQTYHAKWEGLSGRVEKMRNTISDPNKAHQVNVQAFLKQMEALGNLEQFPQVRNFVVFFLLFSFCVIGFHFVIAPPCGPHPRRACDDKLPSF